MALSYVLMGLVDVMAGRAPVAPVWIIVFYIVITIAELCVFPIGLAEISKRVPPELVGLLMGFWVFTMGFGSLTAGWLGGWLAHAPDLDDLRGAGGRRHAQRAGAAAGRAAGAQDAGVGAAR